MLRYCEKATKFEKKRTGLYFFKRKCIYYLVHNKESIKRRCFFSLPSFGVVHKLCWQNFVFFDCLPPCFDIFYGMKVDKKLTFLDHLPTSSCKRSLWTTPKLPRQKSSDIYSTGPMERMGTCGLREVVPTIFWLEILFQLGGRGQFTTTKILKFRRPCAPGHSFRFATSDAKVSK